MAVRSSQSAVKPSKQSKQSIPHFAIYLRHPPALKLRRTGGFGRQVGITGHPFQSPFATPPGEGLSSASINVLWGSFNLAVAYWLLARVGKFDLKKTGPVVVAAVGALCMAIMLAQHFGKFNNGNL